MDIPIVTLDKIYIKPDEENIFFLDCTRINGSDELTTRTKGSLEEQVKDLRNRIKSRQVILADDVVFSGSVLKKIISLLKGQGIEVVQVVSCICTKEGYDYFNKNLKYGLKTNILLEEDVIDQICERDFYFGIAGSGIVVKTKEGFMKAPYFEPFGNPNERASIPKKDSKSFSEGCIKRSIMLWEEIDKLKGEKTKMSELPEKIVGTKENDEVVKVLKLKGRSL